MSKLLLQATTIAGRIIENGKWAVEIPISIQKDQIVSLNLPIQDVALINYLRKQKSIHCVIDTDNDEFVVSISCTITRIRHMIHTITSAIESMAFICPNDRLCDHALTYLIAQNLCDPKFIKFIKEGGVSTQ